MTSLTLLCCLLASPLHAEEPRVKKIFIDLQPDANKPLDEVINDGVYQDDDLAELRQGRMLLEKGVEFQIGPKCVVLKGKHAPDRPAQMDGFVVGSKISGLQILHACGWGAFGTKGDAFGHIEDEGTLIGYYRVNYEDGDWGIIPIVYGRDVRDWWGIWDNFKPTTRSRIVWRGNNKHLRQRPEAKNFEKPLRLFLTAWSNPRAEVKVASIDMVSVNQVAAPFCVAMTALASDSPAVKAAPHTDRVQQLTTQLQRLQKRLIEERQARIQTLTEQVRKSNEELERLRKETAGRAQADK